MESPTPVEGLQHRVFSSPHHKDDVLLEGYLLKQGSRSSHSWHERYFVMQSDSTLRYFQKRTSSKPKASIALGSLGNSEVSDLFVKRHNRKLVYCVRLTWSAAVPSHSKDLGLPASSSLLCENIPTVPTDEQALDDNSSSVDGGLLLRGSPGDEAVTLTPRLERMQSNDETPRPKRRGRASFRRPSSRKSNHNSSDLNSPLSPGRSTDDDSFQSGRIKRPSIKKKRQQDSMNADEMENLDIPVLVEVDNKDHNPEVVTPKARHQSRYEKEIEEEQDYLKAQYLTQEQESRRKSKQKLVQGSKLAVATGATVGLAVVTAGIGLVAGLVFLGAAVAGGGSAALSSFTQKNEGELVIASEDYEVALSWKCCLEAAVESAMVKASKWGQLFTQDGRKTRLAWLPQATSNDAEASSSVPRKERRTVTLEGTSNWVPVDGGWLAWLGNGVQSLRIFREEKQRQGYTPTSSKNATRFVTDVSVDGKPCAPMKAHVVINSSSLNAFLCLMSCGSSLEIVDGIPVMSSDLRSSFRVVESFDDNTDVIHMVTRPLYLFPNQTYPRDYCLFRYWRLEPDGTYTVCYESVEHESCPPLRGHVRAEMHQVFTISPPKKSRRRRNNTSTVNRNECLVTAVVQVDPKGWVPTTKMSVLCGQSYADAFGISSLVQLLEIRDAIDTDRFLPSAMELSSPPSRNEETSRTFRRLGVEEIPNIASVDSVEEVGGGVQEDFVHYDYSYACNEISDVSQTMSGLLTTPPPLERIGWAEPDSNSFRVRGKNYLEDRKKYNAGASIGRLIAVDVVSVDKPIYSGFTRHPKERVQLALQKEAALEAKGLESTMPPFIFVVNIVLPGPPVYHGVFYYAVDDISTIDGTDGTPSSKLCREFFFGESDDFRDKTFKLIPQIVQGNFLVRRAVGSTPAIIGKKLRQLYVRSDRFFEVIMDCGSSPVAAGVVSLSLGYARSLVVDMAFLLEANDNATLPERIFGCVRMKHPDFGPHMRLVKCPESEDGTGDEDDELAVTTKR